jgi:oligopeptidase B
MPRDARPATAPPSAAKIPRKFQIHSTTLADDYAWMRERDKPEVAAMLEAENAYTNAIMEPTRPLQQELYDEMVSHLKETDTNVPYRDGRYYYYSRTDQGKQYPIFCRKLESLDAPEQIVLDVNQLAEGQSFMSIGDISISDDGRLLAYSTDNRGFRQFNLHIRDLSTGADLPDTAERVGSIVWAAGNRTLFYTVESETDKRQYQLYRHNLGADRASDVLVLEESDERFNIGTYRTRSKQYLLLNIGSHTTSEVRYLRATEPEGSWQLIAPRRDNIEYYVDERHDHFYLRINDTSRTFRLVRVPVGGSEQKWQEIIPARDDVAFDDCDLFENFFVIEERVAGLPRLRVIDFVTNVSQSIDFPDPTYTVKGVHNAEFATAKYRYMYQSLVTPNSVYDYDVASHLSTLLKRTEVPGGFDPANYASERVFATASDGARIPISLVYRKDQKQRGSNPLYVYGYGSYGYSLPVTFNSNRLCLLDRGFVMAYAHIRGGGELGQPWHDAGRMMQKRNTFTDFIAAVEHLVAQKYGARDRVAIEGGSAGGLLMGAVTNMRPDLFRAVISHVPFVDVMNTMLDASLPLTIGEYEEWGNPNEEPAFKYMLSYSPYENLHRASYPAMLVKTSFHDSQFMYWEPAKYVARLRTLNTGNNLLLLHTNMNAGHGGASGRYDYLREIALDYAFLLTVLDVEPVTLAANAAQQ